MSGVGSQTKADERREIRLEIAGVSIALRSQDCDLTFSLDGAVRGFMAEGNGADIEVTAAWADIGESSIPSGDLLFDSGAVWRLLDCGGDYIFSFNSPILGPGPYKIAKFNREFTRGHVDLNRDSFKAGIPVYPMEYPLDELIVLNWLAQGRGIEMHSCGLIDSDGRGLLFAGQSGAGKTTTARLWENTEGVKILSDDRIILRKIGGEIWMHGTPWHGDAELASPAAAKLNRVYFIKHGAGNSISELSQAGAIARLFSCSFPPFHSHAGLDFTLGFMSEVAAAAACSELSFAPAKEVVGFVRQAAVR